MDIKMLPKETLAELLFYLADNEEFNVVREHLADGFTVEEVRATLRELATELAKEASLEGETQYNPQKDVRLSPEAKSLISYLSPGEEKTLLHAFGVLEKPKSLLKPA